jgi:hypothetical protein
VNTLARRAYRRPVTIRDTELLMGFYQEGRNDGSFDKGIETALNRGAQAPPIKPQAPTELRDDTRNTVDPFD